MRETLVLVAMTALAGAARGASADEPAPAPDVALSLQLTTMGDYDPAHPSGKVVCLALNRGGEPCKLPAGYDGGQIVLFANGLSLHRVRRHGEKAEPLKTVTIEPQQEVVLFEFVLDEILEPREPIAAAPPVWYWSWPKRSSPPHSPLDARRRAEKQYVDEVVFFVAMGPYATLDPGDAAVRSPRVTLGVKSPAVK